MKSANPYLNFDGNAREAMNFYAKCLGGKLEVMTWGDAPGGTPESDKDKVMHACLTSGPVVLMGADRMPGQPFTVGNNITVALHCESPAEGDRLFAALGENGTPTMPMQDTFWGAYFGMLVDQFGVGWMFNCEKAPALQCP